MLTKEQAFFRPQINGAHRGKSTYLQLRVVEAKDLFSRVPGQPRYASGQLLPTRGANTQARTVSAEKRTDEEQ